MDQERVPGGGSTKKIKSVPFNLKKREKVMIAIANHDGFGYLTGKLGDLWGKIKKNPAGGKEKSHRDWL